MEVKKKKGENLLESVQSNDETAGQKNKVRKPVASNNDGVAVWLKRDKNGDAYLSIKVGFIGYTNVFIEDDRFQEFVNGFYLEKYSKED